MSDRFYIIVCCVLTSFHFQTPPITQFFKQNESGCCVATGKIERSALDLNLDDSSQQFGQLTACICQQIRDKKYHKYITRIHTHSLGGISPQFRAHAEHSLFPYKPFSTPKVQDSKSMSRLEEARGIQDKNNLVEEKMWTDEEKQIFDKTLRAYARWEVDFTNGVVWSVQCEGTTSNPQGICQACQDVLNDESFKRSVQRVSCAVSIVGIHGILILIFFYCYRDSRPITNHIT